VPTWAFQRNQPVNPIRVADQRVREVVSQTVVTAAVVFAHRSEQRRKESAATDPNAFAARCGLTPKSGNAERSLARRRELTRTRCEFVAP
jgi:hypothetical protein